VSVDMDVVGVMAAYLPGVRVCTALSREALNCNCIYELYRLIEKDGRDLKPL